MGRLALGAVLVCSGCAQLLGIADTTGGGSGADAGPGGDAPPPPGVSLRFVRMSVGATVIEAPQDLTGQTATYLVSDATQPSGIRDVTAMLSGTDTWTAAITDGTPPIEFTLPDYPTPIARLYELPARTLVGLYGVLEHPDPTPAPPGATLAVNINLDAPYTGAEAYDLYTVGSWTNRGLTPPAVNTAQLVQSVTFDQPGTSITGRPAEKITMTDAVLVLRYVGNALTGYFRCPGFEQTGNDPVTGTMAAVADDQALNVTIHPGAVASRFANIRPAMGSLSMAYYLNAAPGYTIANNAGPQLQAVGVAPTDSGAVSLTYGNPFLDEGWHAIMTWTTTESRTYTVAGLPATLSAAMNQFIEPSTGYDLTLPAGLPTSISIDQQPLLSDGLTITVDPTKSVTLSFVPDQPGATLNQLQIFELVPNAGNTAMQYVLQLAITGEMPQYSVPGTVFQAGHYYTLRAFSTVGGYPGLSTGDLTQRALPLAQAYADSGVFMVTAP